jgi:hypothetical protein
MALISTGTNSEAVSHSYSHTLKLVRNDTSPELNLTLTDGTDNTAGLGFYPTFARGGAQSRSAAYVTTNAGGRRL